MRRAPAGLGENEGVSAVAFSDRRVILRAVMAATLISAVGLSACGRKGALEPPPKADVTSGEDQGSGKDDTRPNTSFPLDFLL
jgi:predicted small lipoprotein YifL